MGVRRQILLRWNLKLVELWLLGNGACHRSRVEALFEIMGRDVWRIIETDNIHLAQHTSSRHRGWPLKLLRLGDYCGIHLRLLLAVALEPLNHRRGIYLTRWPLSNHLIVVDMALAAHPILDLGHLSLSRHIVVFRWIRDAIGKWPISGVIFEIVLLKLWAIRRLEHLWRRLGRLKLWRNIWQSVTRHILVLGTADRLAIPDWDLPKINVSVLVFLMHYWLRIDIALRLVAKLRQSLRRLRL